MSIKEALGMEQEKCDELVREQQMERISMMVEGMFEESQADRGGRAQDARGGGEP